MKSSSPLKQKNSRIFVFIICFLFIISAPGLSVFGAEYEGGQKIINLKGNEEQRLNEVGGDFEYFIPIIFYPGPSLTITGMTADGDPMAGDLEKGFVLETTNDPKMDHLLQFADGTVASEPLADEHFGLYLVDSTVSPDDLKAYYVAHGTPNSPIDFLSYLQDAADGLNPFVYINGSTVQLVDAAKWDLLGEVHDMTVPDDFPLGTYTIEGQIEDEAGTPSTVTLILIVSGDRVAPELTITGATADDEPMGGDLETGFVLETTNDSEINHLLQFADGTVASEPLTDEYFGLYLVDSTISAEDLKDYYVAHGTPSSPIDFLSYLQDAADGLNPFVYINGSTVQLVDAAKWDLLGEVHDMTVPDDFPLGTYTVEGEIEDLAGNPTTVTLILVVEPTLKIDIDHEEGILSGDWEGDNGGGHVGVSAEAALAGTGYGLWADSGEGTSQYAYLNFPPVETDIMRLRFYIDIQNVIHDGVEADDFLHIIGVKTHNEQDHICYIRLRHSHLGYYIQLDAKEDGDLDYHLTSPAGSILASAENIVEIMIVRADSGQSNGEAYLLVNGSLQASATDLDNDEQFTNLGFIEAGVFHKNGTWAGNVFLDEIIMTETDEMIGPLGGTTLE